jgi:tetratricopeptide (TPR) repeat protein
MIAWTLSLRRVGIVAFALACAAPMLRSAVSSALVTRGDSLLYAHDQRAQGKYLLALQIDSANMVAADRFIFAVFLSRNGRELADAIAVGDAVLREHPQATDVRMDRALCLQLLKRYAQAEPDFERVGRERGDVRALALAASDAARIADVGKANGLLRLARQIDPDYAPVRLALDRARE